MKAKIVITPKKAVLDPQGKTVQNALEQMGYRGVTGVHIGKYIEIDLAPGADKAAAEQALNDAAHKFLSNPVIEDYKLEIELNNYDDTIVTIDEAASRFARQSSIVNRKSK